MTDRKQDFINKAKRVHAGENLDYSNVVYINNRTPVEIIDHDLKDDGSEYGPFWQTPSNHLKGQKHPLKRSSSISKSKRSNIDDIIKRFKEVHSGENLDYSCVEYVNMHTKVKIIDHDLDSNGIEFGEYWQEPSVHLKGCGHPRKGRIRQIESQKYTTKTFIDKAKKMYGDSVLSYDYVNYVNSKTKVDIFCNKIGNNGKPHGHFFAYPDLFLQGKSCPICGNHKSIAENEIYDLLCSLLGEQNVVRGDKKLLNGLELDLYVPIKKIAIEFNGLLWHCDKYKNDKYYHLNKTKKCCENGVTLIQVFEDEYLTKKTLIFDKIKHFIGFNYSLPTIHARSSKIKEITTSEAREFLNIYHIQGFSPSSVYLGAFNCDKLFAVMTFKKENSNSGKWDLNRYCTNINFKCPGIASKLFKYFIRNYNPVEVKSFLDYRWCNNFLDNLYIKLGFKLEEVLKPDYKYTNGHGLRIHKFLFRKRILSKKYGFPITMTEREMTEKLGYYKIWDCGLIKYVWKKEKA